jgi:hypothetical protein
MRNLIPPILRHTSACALAELLVVTSSSLSVLAQTAPLITRQPVSISRSLGASAEFAVSVSGDAPLTYQWQHEGVDLSGATKRTLTITSVALLDSGSYRLIISNSVGTAKSDAAELDVDPTFTKVSAGDFVKNSEWSGISAGDYDGDGFLDLYAGGPYVYRNDPARPGEFKKVSIGGGISTNPGDGFGLWGDYDNDGKLDLFVTQGADGNPLPNRLLHNEGNGIFRQINTTTFSSDSGSFSFGAAWGDYDRDGYLDLFVANNNAGTKSVARSSLYHNRGDGTFTRVTDWEIGTSEANAFGCNWSDVNGDGWPDLTVGVNPGGQSIYWENQQGKGFERFVLPGGGGDFINGPCWADFDNSRNLSAFVPYSGLQTARLIGNDGQGNFEPLFDSDLSTITQGYGGTWGDFDNDGWLDLFVPRTGAYVKNTSNTNALWRNNGDGSFTQILTGSLATDASNTSSAAWADFDNDGFLDLAVGGGGSAKNLLYRNNGNSNSWLALKLIGAKSNRSAIGAKIRVTATIRGQVLTQLREIGSDAVFAQNDPRPHFGLGDASLAQNVRIEWPSGQIQELTNILVKQFLTIIEPGGPPKLNITRTTDPAFVMVEIVGEAEQDYELQSSPDLITWTTTSTLRTGADQSAQQSISESASRQFFRALSISKRNNFGRP